MLQIIDQGDRTPREPGTIYRRSSASPVPAAREDADGDEVAAYAR